PRRDVRAIAEEDEEVLRLARRSGARRPVLDERQKGGEQRRQTDSPGELTTAQLRHRGLRVQCVAATLRRSPTLCTGSYAPFGVASPHVTLCTLRRCAPQPYPGLPGPASRQRTSCSAQRESSSGSSSSTSFHRETAIVATGRLVNDCHRALS